MTSPVLAIAGWAVLKRGFDIESLKVAALVAAFYGFVFVIIRGMQIGISETGITWRQYFFVRRSVPFREIDHSEVQYLAEADHPISLSIYRTATQAPAFTIPLKSFARDDVQWLIGREALKVLRYPGFTNPGRNA